jgi:hypothetical protein
MVWLTGGGNHYLSRTIAPARQPVLAYGFDAYLNGCSGNYSCVYRKPHMGISESTGKNH